KSCCGKMHGPLAPGVLLFGGKFLEAYDLGKLPVAVESCVDEFFFHWRGDVGICAGILAEIHKMRVKPQSTSWGKFFVRNLYLQNGTSVCFGLIGSVGKDESAFGLDIPLSFQTNEVKSGVAGLPFRNRDFLLRKSGGNKNAEG